jgi:hypothetical protein
VGQDICKARHRRRVIMKIDLGTRMMMYAKMILYTHDYTFVPHASNQQQKKMKNVKRHFDCKRDLKLKKLHKK